MSPRTRRSVVCFTLALLGLAALSPGSGARRPVPDDTLVYPVLVSFQNGGQGSGFFLNLHSGTFLVTARHVLFKEDTDNLLGREAVILSYAKDPNDNGKNVFQLDLVELKRAGNIKRHATHDVTVVRIGVPAKGTDLPSLNILSGVVIKEKASSGILGVAEWAVKRFADVLSSNQVFIFGFPTSIGVPAPLLRAVVVAGTDEQTKTMILECPANCGISGGPVLGVEEEGPGKKFHVIGVVSQLVPVANTWLKRPHPYGNIKSSNSEFAIAIPMDFVLELTSQF